MLLPSKLIEINGKINNIPIKILFDTGASTNCIWKSKIKKFGLDYIVDKKQSEQIFGVNGFNKSYGNIWYLDIELELENGNKTNESRYASVPITTTVLDDNFTEKETKTEISSNCNFDMILGINFMKSYRTNIDFGSMTITLNNSIKIKFK